MNTLIGIATVFLMLGMISIIIYCFKFIHAWDERRHAAASPSVQPARSVPAAQPAAVLEPEEEELTDDLELVAVIAAAIAASEGTSPDGLVVRSIRRIGTSRRKRS